MKDSLKGIKQGFQYEIGNQITLVFGSHRTLFKGVYSYVCIYNTLTKKLSCTREYIVGANEKAEFTPSQTKMIINHIKKMRGCSKWKTA